VQYPTDWYAGNQIITNDPAIPLERENVGLDGVLISCAGYSSDHPG